MTTKSGLERYIIFLENVDMSAKAWEEMDRLKVRDAIVNIKIVEYQPLRNYTLALEAYKLAKWTAKSDDQGGFAVALQKVSTYLQLLVNAIDAKDVEHLSLFNGLYAAYYFLSLMSSHEKLTVEQRIKLGFSYLKRALEKGLDKDKKVVKYVDLVLRLKEIKQLIQEQSRENKELIQKYYQEVVEEPFKKKNIDIGRIFSPFENIP